MAWIAGVDGCKGGWIAVYEDTDSGKLDCRVEKMFGKMMAKREIAVVAVDMPIGLSEDGKRACDTAARRVLGKRHSSIFSAPAKEVIDCFRSVDAKAWKERGTYQRVNAKNGLSKQSYNLVPKIAEVALYVDTHRKEGRRIYEAHPEVSFAAMKAHKDGATESICRPKSDYEMRYPKKTFGGLAERRALLRPAFGPRFEELEVRAAQDAAAASVAPDDFYDALACLWTARRICAGEARGLPGCDPVGSASRPMRIVY